VLKKLQTASVPAKERESQLQEVIFAKRSLPGTLAIHMSVKAGTL